MPYLAATTTRSILRPSSARAAASRFASQSKCKPKLSSQPSPSKNPLSQSFLRRHLETSSFAVEAMMPYHSATASALMTSMLSLSHFGYGRLPDDS